MRRGFPEVWARLKQAAATKGKLTAAFTEDLSLTESAYPWWLRDRLYAAEDATLHAMFKDTGSKVRATVGDASPADLEEMSDRQNTDGVWWSQAFQAAKPQLAPDPLDPRRTLRLTVDRNDMSDLVLLLTPTS
jgi:hypothetical protein